MLVHFSCKFVFLHISVSKIYTRLTTCNGFAYWAIFDSFATDVMFQPSNGDRFDAPNYLVILTDGNSDNATSTWHEAMRARSRGINIITVSITAPVVLLVLALPLSFLTYMCNSASLMSRLSSKLQSDVRSGGAIWLMLTG